MPIRFARPADAKAIHAIYAHYARETAVTFADEAPSAAHYAAQIADRRYPFLVAEEDGQVAGFVYAGEFRTKAAFRWDVELTLYLAPGQTGRGLGSALMSACLTLLAAQGYVNAYSCVTLPNPASIALHRRFGFAELGVFPRTGYKLGRWHDVIWLTKPLAAPDGPPPEPRPLTDDDLTGGCL